MEFFIKMMQSTALVSGFLIVTFAFVGLIGAIIWRLIKSDVDVSAKERENADVVVESRDWLLAIVKFIGIILCFLAVTFIMPYFHAIQSLFCHKIGVSVEKSFDLFMLGIFTIFLVGLGIFSIFGIIKISAKESAIARKKGE